MLALTPAIALGGAENRVLLILEEARRRGWDVTLAHAPDTGCRELVQRAELLGVRIISLDLVCPTESPIGAFWRQLRQLVKTLKLLHQARPEVALLSLPWPTNCLGVAVACALAKVPLVVTFHLAPDGLSLLPGQGAVYRWLRRRTAAWIAVSSATARTLAEGFGISLDAFEVVLTCLSGDSLRTGFSPRLKTRVREDWLLELGLPGDTQIAVTLARLDPLKGHEDLLAVLPALRSEFPKVVFLIAGDGERRVALEKSIRSLGLERKVFLVGKQDRDEMFCLASWLILPSRNEGAPFAVLEAMAHGVPIVASRAGGTGELLREETDAILFPPGDREAILTAMRRAFSSPAEMAKRAVSARGRIEALHEERGLEKIVDRIAVAGARGTLR